MSLEWPESLPGFAADGYEETFPDSRIWSDPDMGPQKVRRRFSAQSYHINASMQLTEAQLTTFETFYVTTTEGGSLSFTIPNPRKTGTLTVRFGNSPPSAGDFEGEYCMVTLELEVLP